MLTRGPTYRDVCRAFEWRIPEYYNIGTDVCDRHAGIVARPALIYEKPDGTVERYSIFGQTEVNLVVGNCAECALRI